MRAPVEHDPNLPADQALCNAVGTAVRAPLAALRASMETLVRGFQSGDPRSLAVRGALDEVVSLGHELQTLLDFALPLPVQPISCSLREIVCSAVDGLRPQRRAEVWTAIDDRRARIEVDGPLLSRSIARLLGSIPLGVRAPALLRARTESTDAVFTVVLEEKDPTGARERDLSTTSAASMLGVVLARRDVERMGGRFSFRRSLDDRTVAEIRFSALHPGRFAA